MKAGNTRLFQKWYKDLQLFLQYAGVAVMGILLTDCQLIINGVIRQLGADGGNRFYGKSSPPFRASAVGVCTMVEAGGAKASAHPISMHLHHIKSGLLGQYGCIAERRGNFFDFMNAQF